MDTKHTPGPWRFSEDDCGQDCVLGPNGEKVVEGTCYSDLSIPNEYDAILIAAAPELLEALADMVDMFERHIDGRPGPDDAGQRWDAARAAIAKATGRA